MATQTVGNLLAEGTTTLSNAGIQSARLDTLLFLEDITGYDRAHLLAYPELGLDDSKAAMLRTFIVQRSAHTPIAYIRGKAPFFGREFTVSPAVLVPRPETEVMIELLLKIRSDLSGQPYILDVGTGSGCLGVTASLEIPASTVYVSDIDDTALQVASQNADKHNAHVHTQHANLLNGLDEPFEVMLCNLPYVPDDYHINQAARFEPAKALFAGSDGLDLYRTFWQQLIVKRFKPSHIFMESLLFQHQELEGLARKAGYTLANTQDLIQHFVPATLQ